MRFTAEIGECEMDQVILDLVSDVNVLQKQISEHMGRLTLQSYPIHLRMVNQKKILLMGRLQGIMVDIKGVSVLADFEVIKIVDDRNPYPTLLGIGWAIDMNGAINLKKRKMIFEKKSLCIVVPLDSVEGSRYRELVHDCNSDDDLDCIYKITTQDQDWVNPTVDGRISWERESSCTSYSDEEIERWQNQLHKVTKLNYNMMIRSLRCVATEARDLPMYNGLTVVDHFLNKFEKEVPEQ